MEALSETEFRAAVELLRQLIQIDTSNPPGNEKPAIDLIATLLRNEGLSPEMVGSQADRPNLVCRLRSEMPLHRPLILSCHLDVVPAPDAEQWSHPPFSAEEVDGCIWGRGAIDMKGFAAMAVAVFCGIARSDLSLTRDLILVAVCDEEAGTGLGSRWLVENRPDLLGDQPEYVINEVGGFTLHRDGRRFYPIQVAEKGVAWLRMTAKGPPGHASLPAPNSAAARLTRAAAKIASARLPWHPSAEAERFVESMAAKLGPIAKAFAPLLLNPITGPLLVSLAVPKRLRPSFEALQRNTATPTVIQVGESINVVPSQGSCDIDGRLAPGQTAVDLIGELETIVSDEAISFEVLHTHTATSSSIDTPLFHRMVSTIESADPGSFAVPSLVQGFTDSHNYAKLGAACYGFYPVKLPPEMDFAALFHGIDERIPVAGLRWGIDVLRQVVNAAVTEEAR